MADLADYLGLTIGQAREQFRALLSRVGQHVFAQHVLANCGGQCVFCGLKPAAFGAARMLLAGHIKP